MKNKKRIYALVLLAIILISSIGIYLNYENISKNQKQSTIDAYSISYVIADDVTCDTYLFKQQLDNKSNKDTSISNYFQVTDANDFESVASTFQSRMADWTYQLTQDDKNFKYQAKNKEGAVVTNSEDPLETIATTPSLQEKYIWYVTLTFDSNGTINYTSNDSTVWHQSFQEYSSKLCRDLSSRITTGSVSLTPPTDMTVTFAIPKVLDPSGGIYAMVQNDASNQILSSGMPVIGFAIVIVALFSLLYPIALAKTQNPIKQMLSIKIEILATLLFLGIPSIFICIMELMKIVTYETFNDLLLLANAEFMYDFIIASIHIILWSALLFLISICIFSIKCIFDKGLVCYIKENSCLGWCIKKMKKLIDTILSVDMSTPDNQAILKIIVVNFIIVTIISTIFGAAGLWFSLLYSIVLFVILKNKFASIQKDYTTLLQATSELSKGNFDIEIQEDLGMFNSLKEEFTNIKDGFEKAVNEEVKSQKMKTELISNVSHDLKTPLTSIISYIDLLKDNSLDETQRIQYVETIERNSLRLKNLIEDLFEVSKVNSGNIQLQLTEVDIIALLQQVQFECLDKLQVASLEVKTQYSSDKIICSLDSSKTYRIFENLLINICKHALSNTRVYIQVEEKANQVSITFKNISANEIEVDPIEIVERFVQGDKSRTNGGSGLGLAIAKSFTEVQGGHFNIEIDGDLFKAIVILKKA